MFLATTALLQNFYLQPVKEEQPMFDGIVCGKRKPYDFEIKLKSRKLECFVSIITAHSIIRYP